MCLEIEDFSDFNLRGCNVIHRVVKSKKIFDTQWLYICHFYSNIETAVNFICIVGNDESLRQAVTPLALKTTYMGLTLHIQK